MSEVVQETRRYEVDEVEGPVTYHDYLILAGIYKQAHPELDRGSQSLVHLKDTLDYLADPLNPNTALLIARDTAGGRNRAVGAAMLYVMGPIELDARGTVIEEIFVEKRSRGNSIGRLLLDHAINFAERNDSTHVQLGSPPQTVGARRLFGSMDFSEDHQGVLRHKLGNSS